MKNYYTDKPAVPYQRTTINMAIVIASLGALKVPVEAKRMAYIMFRNESANGRSGINHNYCGFQADSGRWAAVHDAKIAGVVTLKENGTGRLRLFLAFRDVSGCLEMLVERVLNRGLYIGGTTHKIVKMPVTDMGNLCRAYIKEWVKGSAKAEPGTLELANFKTMYQQAATLFH